MSFCQRCKEYPAYLCGNCLKELVEPLRKRVKLLEEYVRRLGGDPDGFGDENEELTGICWRGGKTVYEFSALTFYPCWSQTQLSAA